MILLRIKRNKLANLKSFKKILKIIKIKLKNKIIKFMPLNNKMKNWILNYQEAKDKK